MNYFAEMQEQYGDIVRMVCDQGSLLNELLKDAYPESKIKATYTWISTTPLEAKDLGKLGESMVNSSVVPDGQTFTHFAAIE